MLVCYSSVVRPISACRKEVFLLWNTLLFLKLCWNCLVRGKCKISKCSKVNDVFLFRAIHMMYLSQFKNIFLFDDNFGEVKYVLKFLQSYFCTIQHRGCLRIAWDWNSLFSPKHWCQLGILKEKKTRPTKIMSRQKQTNRNVSNVLSEQAQQDVNKT